MRLTELPETLLEGVLLCHAHAVALAWRQGGFEFLFGPGYRLLIDGFDILGPASQFLILGKIVFQIMDVAQEVNPTTLMQTLMDVVSGVEITSDPSLVVLN